MTLSFVYLLIAAIFQLAWLYNMKRIKKGIWKGIKTKPVFSTKKLIKILPIVFYLVFGISNVVFLTWAMDQIPPSIAYAVWTGIVIGAAAIIDHIVQKQPFRLAKAIFILMIAMGIVGLKWSYN